MTEQFKQAIREFAEKWVKAHGRWWVEETQIAENIITDLTALISEGYVSREEHEKLVTSTNGLLLTIKELRENVNQEVERRIGERERIAYLKGITKYTVWADYITNGDELCDKFQEELRRLTSSEKPDNSKT